MCLLRIDATGDEHAFHVACRQRTEGDLEQARPNRREQSARAARREDDDDAFGRFLEEFEERVRGLVRRERNVTEHHDAIGATISM